MGPWVRPLTPVRPSAACGNSPMCKTQTILNYIIYREKNLGGVPARIHSTGGARGSCPDTSVGEGVSMPRRPLSRLRGRFLARRGPRYAARPEHVICGMFLAILQGSPASLGGLSRTLLRGSGGQILAKYKKVDSFFLAL